MPARVARGAPGFSLFELAIVLVVVGLLLGATLTPARLQQEARAVAETRRLLEQAREALLGFAAARGHLPCPDLSGDGEADPRADGAGPDEGCAGGAHQGWLPAASLAVPGLDAWGRRLVYGVSRELTRRAGDPSAAPCVRESGENPCTLELGDAGELLVLARDAASRATPRVGLGLAAVVLSLGPNGHGGTDAAGIAVAAAAGVGDDEAENLDGDRTYVIRDVTGAGAEEPCQDAEPGAPLCPFDDLLIWVSPHVLAGRLVSAGQLP